MYFHKISHPYNFTPFVHLDNSYCFTSAPLGQDTFRIQVRHPSWQDLSEQIINSPALSQDHPNRFELVVDANLGTMVVVDTHTGAEVLRSHQQVPFGVCGSQWLFSFELEDDTRFYGMGEKNLGFEKSGIRTKFWNTDVWADFATDQINNGITDPMYVSLPVLLMKRQDTWVGMMVPSPAAVFMDTGARQVIEGVKDDSQKKAFFYLGAPEGWADLVLTVGNSAREVVTRLTAICGLPDKPPLWALGYHQSRWGYGSLIDAQVLDTQMMQHHIPCDAIWFDIDYMDGYRIFTVKQGVFERKEEVLVQLRAHGRKLVPILDPGIKVDEQYQICQEGLSRDLFCHNSQGNPYVGFVWPGASHFPDFSLPEARAWWADHTEKLAGQGFDAFWVDMNDPSTGSSEVQEMYFGRGTISHDTLHNQYALGMAEATWQGLRQAYPDRRPFILSRSGSLGSSRYGAIWTGDNISNYHHLRKNVEMVLSLSLSGMAFSGNDVGGFGGDTYDELMVDWYQACLLFPFFRNHSADGTRCQEPWRFSEATLKALRTAIQIRYTFLPYLYNLFINLNRTGEPIVRPMVYVSNESRFERLDTQFMIGEALLQAPKLVEGLRQREVVLPAGQWLCLADGKVHQGNQTIQIDLDEVAVPLFLKEGQLVPLASWAGELTSTKDIQLQCLKLLLFPGNSIEGKLDYVYDAGEGYGAEHTVHMAYAIENGLLGVRLSNDAQGQEPFYFSLEIMGDFTQVLVNGVTHKLSEATLSIPGMQAKVMTSETIQLS
jgi:alpha-glucosidase